MMSKTHLAIGLSAALAVAPPTVEGMCYALMGGAIGSLICDIDRASKNPTADFKQGWIIACTVFSVGFLHESNELWQKFKLEYIFSNPQHLICLGVLLILFLIAALGKHRGFSHSLLFFALSTTAVFLISRQTSLFYGIGFLTHLLLDLMNKKPVQIFFPAKGFCLKLCYADGIVNQILMYGGFVACGWILASKFQNISFITRLLR